MSQKTISLTVELLTEMNVPKAFWSLGRDDYFGNPQALQQAEEYIRRVASAIKRGTGLCFYGTEDSGKTFLLTYVIRCLASKGYLGHYLTLEEATSLHFDRESDGIECLRTSTFLALDNVDYTDNRGWRDVLRLLLRSRKDQHFPILLATRLDREAFEACYGGDTFTLVDSYCLWVACQSTDSLRERLRLERKDSVRFKESVF